jgi:hypothetical protein
MADIFVSYASADRDRVWLVVQALRAEGFSVWWDRDVPASAQWEPTIVAALEAAKCVIVFWSRASVASENVRSEARPARKAGRLIQAFLERCEAPHFFGEQQGADLVEWSVDRSAERFQFLVLGVRDLLAGRRP